MAISVHFQGMARVLESEASRKKSLADTPAYEHSYPQQIGPAMDEVIYRDAELPKDSYTHAPVDAKKEEDDEDGVTSLFGLPDVTAAKAHGDVLVDGDKTRAGVCLTQDDAVDFWVSHYPEVFSRAEFDQLEAAKAEYKTAFEAARKEADEIDAFYRKRLSEKSGVPLEDFEAYDRAMAAINAQMGEAFQAAFEQVQERHGLLPKPTVEESLEQLAGDTSALDDELARFQEETSPEAELQGMIERERDRAQNDGVPPDTQIMDRIRNLPILGDLHAASTESMGSSMLGMADVSSGFWDRVAKGLRGKGGFTRRVFGARYWYDGFLDEKPWYARRSIYDRIFTRAEREWMKGPLNQKAEAAWDRYTDLARGIAKKQADILEKDDRMDMLIRSLDMPGTLGVIHHNPETGEDYLMTLEEGELVRHTEDGPVGEPLPELFAQKVFRYFDAHAGLDGQGRSGLDQWV